MPSDEPNLMGDSRTDTQSLANSCLVSNKNEMANICCCFWKTKKSNHYSDAAISYGMCTRLIIEPPLFSPIPPVFHMKSFSHHSYSMEKAGATELVKKLLSKHGENMRTVFCQKPSFRPPPPLPPPMPPHSSSWLGSSSH